MPVVGAVARLVALQAQYAPSPYVALWSWIEGFRKDRLTRALAAGTVVKAGSLCTTLHVMAAAEFPSSVAAYIESQRGRQEGIGVDVTAPVRFLPSFDSVILAQFTVDGFVAGAWRIDGKRLVIEPFARCKCARGARSTPRARGCGRFMSPDDPAA